jgi:hypothetical protein
MADVVSRAADQLYTVPPRRFVAERAAAVATARAAGDRVAAAAIERLRRPTVAAWVVNLLALRRPALVADLVELAGSLRAAQRRLDGAALRELAGQRRATVAALVAEARSLAVAVDPETAGGKLPVAEVEATLHAALADPEVAEQVRAGRLVRPVSPAGFGESAAPRLRLVTGDGEGAAAPDQDDAVTGAADPTMAAREAAEVAVGEARLAAHQAAEEAARATASQHAVQQEVADLDAALAELTARRAEAAQRLTAAESAAFVARRGEAQARQRLAEAEAALAALPEN